MQGNKKHTDGQSDSSSIGSLLDETDREVCSLTDRAFKSLCLDELEASYTEAGPVVSPRIQHPFSNKYVQGPRNHAIKKNMAANKLLPHTEERSTFQPLPKDTPGEKKAVTNSIPNIRRKLGLPVPNLCHYKHTSKVSSLIKTFDKVENQEMPAIAAQLVKTHLPKCPPVCGADMALGGGKNILDISKELSEFPRACQNVGVAHGRHEMRKGRHNPMDLLCQGPPHFYSVPAVTSNIPESSIFTFSKKILKKRTGKAKEPAGRDSFLHSENSAFESWNAHHKKLTGTGRSTERMPAEETLAYLEETPCFKESHMLDRKPSPVETADSVILEQDFSSDEFPQNPPSQISLSPVSLCQNPHLPPTKAGDSLAQPLLPPSSGLATSADRVPTPPPLPSQVPFPRALGPQVVASPEPVSTAPIPPPSMPQRSLPPGADAHVPHVTLHPEKTNGLERDPELRKICPPWRRQKTVLRETEMVADVASKDAVQGNSADVTSLADVAATDSHITVSDASSPSFNISHLLTPLIPRKQEKEPSESPLLTATPPLSEAEATKEPEERAFHGPQNNYKSKASSLLFNLKDIRKRVKSTYSPSPLRRASEDRKKIKEPDSLKASVNNLLEGNSSKSAGNDEVSQKPSGQMGNTQEEARTTLLKEHLQGNHWTSSSPPSKADSLGYQKRNSLQQENPTDLEEEELVSVAEFHPKDHSPGRCPPTSKSEQDTYLQNVSLWDPQSQRGAQSHRADVGPRESPNLFFTAEENVNGSENQACPEGGTEQKDKRSTSSSEQSFVSIIDQPSHEEPFSLMQLFQKACLQESQRNMDKGSVEEKPSYKEEKSGRPEEASHDRGLSNYDSNTDGKSKGKVEQSKEEEGALQEQLQGERREGRGQSLDSASEGKSEEPLTPSSSSSFKPNLFQIKDNTFKSPPVIKAVKLPLFRSLSCDGALAGAYREREKQAYGPFRTTPVIQETDWPLSRNRRQQRMWRAAAATDKEADESGYSPARAGCQRPGNGKLAAESTVQEGLRSFHEQQLVGDDEGAAVTPGIVQNEDKDHKKRLIRDKGKATNRRLRPSSTSQLHPEGDLAQNETKSPIREKTHYYKNNLLSKHRSGSCVKKVITRESRSPTASEIQAYSPAFSDPFGDTLCTASLTSSTVPSPRSDSTMQSAFTSPLSEATATGSTAKAEKTAAPSSLHGGLYGDDAPSTGAETSVPMQTSQLSGHTDGSPVTNERPQLMRQMVRTAAKPPAVPPKTEKALRRAKKLASRRKKAETQQKKSPAESVLPCEDMTPLPSAHSPPLLMHRGSPAMSSESNQVTLPPIPSSPTPSSPVTQRKLLQDPLSGEYFIVDLPTQFKTLYDPESGRYLQVSLPSSKRSLAQTPSSEVLAPPYVLYPSALPLRVSSVPARASPSQFSEPASLVREALSESAPDWQQDGHSPESLNGQPYLESAASEDHAQDASGPPLNFQRDRGLSDKTDIISLGALEDFAVEGIS